MNKPSGDAGSTPVWPSSGHQYLESDAHGRLLITDDYLRHFYRRPELLPVAESCPRERALHDSLLEAPMRAVSAAQIDQFADADGRDNYRTMLNYRDCLLAADTLEDAYLKLVSGALEGPIAPALVDDLTQLLVAHVLNARPADAFEARAAELFFRRQRVALQDGILLVDSERLGQRQPEALTAIQSLLVQVDRDSGRSAPSAPGAATTFDLLNHDSTGRYWSEAISGTVGSDFVLGLNVESSGAASPGLGGLCRILTAWVEHFHALKVRVKPLREIQAERWCWHIGLDVQASGLLDSLYLGKGLSAAQQQQIVMLFQLEIIDPVNVIPSVQDQPIFLGIAMDEQREVRLKPQNLLLNLPLQTVN